MDQGCDQFIADAVVAEVGPPATGGIHQTKGGVDVGVLCFRLIQAGLPVRGEQCTQRWPQQFVFAGMVVVQQVAQQFEMRVDAPGGPVFASRYPGHGPRCQPELPEHRGVDDDHVSDVDQRPLGR